MAITIKIHPETPQERLIDDVVNVLECDNSKVKFTTADPQGIIAYPTSSGYALGCKLDNVKAIEKIRQIRNLQEKQDFTLMCADISQAAKYARIDDKKFRLIKNTDTENFTFLLPAAPLLPKKTNSKRGTVGIRIASSTVIAEILQKIDEPIISTSLLLPDADGLSKGHQVHHGFSRGLDLKSFSYAWQVEDAIGDLIDMIIEFRDFDQNEIETELDPTTVVDLTDYEYEIVRQGKGVLND